MKELTEIYERYKINVNGNGNSPKLNNWLE
jgi:hypothetical protein